MNIYHCRYCKRRYCHCPNCHCRCCHCRNFCYDIISSFFSQLNYSLFGITDEYIDCEKGETLKSNNEGTEIITTQPSNILHNFELEKKQSTNKQINFHNQIINKRSSTKKCISLDTTTTKKTSPRLSSWDIVEDIYDDIHNDEYEKYNEVFEN